MEHYKTAIDTAIEEMLLALSKSFDNLCYTEELTSDEVTRSISVENDFHKEVVAYCEERLQLTKKKLKEYQNHIVDIGISFSTDKQDKTTDFILVMSYNIDLDCLVNPFRWIL